MEPVDTAGMTLDDVDELRDHVRSLIEVQLAKMQAVHAD